MRVNDKIKPVVFTGEDNSRLSISRSNMGEPYRDGVDFSIEHDDNYVSVFVETWELESMRDFLIGYLGGK